ncbi:MAG: hypothetical protein K9M45_00645 [Kiritimatiellales bacterium]|nr:hypothetical protein [Kiritimatiellales bacterium]
MGAEIESQNQVQCPHCGHFTGPLSRCAYCGQRMGKRMKLQTLRVAALLFAIGGLFLLHLYASQREIPLIQIGSIKPTMNFAFVRVQGTVEADSRMLKSGGLFFSVDDGSGTLSAFLGKPQAEDLSRAGIFPRAGDRVSVAGTLSVSAGKDVSLRVQSAGQIEIESAEVKEIPIAEAYSLSDNSSVLINGVISGVSAPREGSRAPWTVEVKDTSGTIQVVFWQDIFEALSDKLLLKPGSGFRVRASVTSYKGQKQLSASRVEDIQLSATTIAAPVVPEKQAEPSKVSQLKISDITAEQKGATTTVYGKVSKVWKPAPDSRAPHKIILSDGSGEIECVYWSKVADALVGNEPKEGDPLEITGRVDVYNDKIQLKVWEAGDIRSSFGSAPVAVLGLMKIGAITKEMAKQVVTVEGTLQEPKSIRGGVVYPLSDGSGTIQLLFWDKQVSGEARDALDVGTRVRVTAAVVDYNGTLELIPADASAFQLLDGKK